MPRNRRRLTVRPEAGSRQPPVVHALCWRVAANPEFSASPSSFVLRHGFRHWSFDIRHFHPPRPNSDFCAVQARLASNPRAN